MFVISYLSIFDSNIFWIIEAQDLIKLIIVIVALGSSAYAILNLFCQLLDRFVDENISKRLEIIFIVLFLIIYLIMIFATWRDGTEMYYYFSIFYTATMLTFTIFTRIINIINVNNRFTIIYYINTVYYAIFAFSLWGLVCGLSVKYGKNSDYTIQFHNHSSDTVDEIQGKVIMILSHHAIFTNEKTLYVIPSNSITKMFKAQNSQ
jgi:hypothetical protein